MAYKKIDQYDEEVTSGLVKNYKAALGLLGEDVEREGLEKTPERVAKAMQFLTQGYQQDANAILNSAKFHEEVSEMVIVKDIEFHKGDNNNQIFLRFTTTSIDFESIYYTRLVYDVLKYINSEIYFLFSFIFPFIVVHFSPNKLQNIYFQYLRLK